MVSPACDASGAGSWPGCSVGKNGIWSPTNRQVRTNVHCYIVITPEIPGSELTRDACRDTSSPKADFKKIIKTPTAKRGGETPQEVMLLKTRKFQDLSQGHTVISSVAAWPRMCRVTRKDYQVLMEIDQMVNPLMTMSGSVRTTHPRSVLQSLSCLKHG